MLICVFLFVSIFLYYHLWHKRRHLPPGPLPLPFFGNFLQMDSKRPDKTLHKWGKYNGGVFTVWMPGPVVVITDLGIMHKVVARGNFPDRPDDFAFETVHRGKIGVVQTSGILWKEHISFSLRSLKDLGFGRAAMEGQILEEIRRFTRQIDSHKGAAFDPKHDLFVCINSIIGRLLFGHWFEYGDQHMVLLRGVFAEAFHLFGHPFTQMLRCYSWLRFVPLFQNFNFKRFRAIEKIMNDHIFNEIHIHRLNFDERQKPKDLIESYLHEQNRKEKSGKEQGTFCDLQMFGTVLDIWAATDTTWNSLQWAFIYMVHYPEIQRKVHQEIDSQSNNNQHFCMADRESLPYVCAVINEVQRLAYIFGITILRSNKEQCRVGKFEIPAYTAVMFQASAVLHDSSIFPEPHKFDPTRFLNPDGSAKNVPEFVPFSVGKRKCPGESLAKLEIFLIFAQIMRKYKITAPLTKCPALSLSSDSPWPLNHSRFVPWTDFSCTNSM